MNSAGISQVAYCLSGSSPVIRQENTKFGLEEEAPIEPVRRRAVRRCQGWKRPSRFCVGWGYADVRNSHKPRESEFRLRRAGGFLDSLPPDAMRTLEEMVVPLYCPAKAVLFQEQERATRIFILFDGCAKLSVNSSAGKRMILWVAQPPELLGLSPILSDSFHEMTAETLHRCRVDSIPRGEFLDFLSRHPVVWHSVAREVSLEMSRACSRMRTIGLSSVAATRLAMLLLEWSSGARAVGQGICVRVLLTHGEIGECIGTTRETVTRALAELRQRQLIEIHGSSFIIANRFALEAYAHSSRPVLLPAAWPSSSRVGHPAVAALSERGAGDRRIRQA